MKKLLPILLLMTIALTSCGGGKDAANNADFIKGSGTDIKVDNNGNVNINTTSGSSVSVDSSGVTIKDGSGSANVSTDESLKEIDNIINDIANEK